ncbi:MAG: hypothetical protein PF569_08165, partial [Candidatus Woesearchaeota archaeon]|nr:hypothetical protein [Candidatus Woesearchaeota archaeon]
SKPKKDEKTDIKERRIKNKQKQIFSLNSNELQYCEGRIPQEIIDENKFILDGHIIPKISERKCLEAAIFCLASQALVFERASTFANDIAKTSDENLQDNEFVYNLSRQYLRFPEDRFTPFYKYSNKYKGGLTSLAQDILDNPRELREEITSNVKFMGLKTTSFWYLCLGGKELMTLDVHNLRQISNLDIIPIKESHYLGKRRSTGKCIPTGTSNKEYLKIEKEVQQYFRENMMTNTFLFENGNLDSSFLTALFWWEGVKIERGINPYQTNLFKNTLDLGKVLPYHLDE